MKNNDILKNLLILDYTHEGLGVGKVDNFPIFIAGAMVGEIVDVKITDKQKKFAFGQATGFLTTSEHRIKPRCQVYDQCGGCNIMEFDYEEQLKFKSEAAANIIKKNKITTEVNKCLASSESFNYRNKIIVKVLEENGKIVAGYNKYRQHDLLKINECHIIENELNNVLVDVINCLNKIDEKVFDVKKLTGNIRSIFLRKAMASNEIMVTIICYEDNLKNNELFVKELTTLNENIKTIVVNKNPKINGGFIGAFNNVIYGEGYIIDNIGDLKFRISPQSFLQVNPFQVENLYNLAIEGLNLNKEDVMLDAFCGSGTIGLLCAKHVKKVVGVEIIKEAIKDANFNRKLNNISNIEFQCKNMENFDSKNYNFNTMMINPPRKGIEKQFMSLILEILPEKIAYISCKPSTLARDLKILEEHYVIHSVTPVDMFPQTYHVESVAILTKKPV